MLVESGEEFVKSWKDAENTAFVLSAGARALFIRKIGNGIVKWLKDTEKTNGLVLLR